MIDDLTALARLLLGPQVEVVAGRIEELQEPLWPGEAAFITRAVAARQADFAAGRTAARQAMALMGRPPMTILQGLGGAPIWPAGLTGSITHGGGLCLAVAANLSEVRSLGVDLEPLAPLEPSLIAEICTPDERDWIVMQADPTDLPLRIFTAKEAVYKALYPLTGIVLDFSALDIRVDRGSRSFTARLNADLPPFPRSHIFVGGQGTVSDYILSTLRLAPNAL